MTSELLGDYLNSIPGGPEAETVNANRNGKSHMWLVVDSLIVDLTADQFPDGRPAVYVGPEDSWYASWEVDIRGKASHGERPHHRTNERCLNGSSSTRAAHLRLTLSAHTRLHAALHYRRTQGLRSGRGSTLTLLCRDITRWLRNLPFEATRLLRQIEILPGVDVPSPKGAPRSITSPVDCDPERDLVLVHLPINCFWCCVHDRTCFVYEVLEWRHDDRQ